MPNIKPANIRQELAFLLICIKMTTYTTVAPTNPTHYRDQHNTRPDVLDISVLKNIKISFQIQTLNKLSSDHNPIFLELGSPIISPWPQIKRKLQI